MDLNYVIIIGIIFKFIPTKITFTVTILQYRQKLIITQLKAVMLSGLAGDNRRALKERNNEF
jgi:hypothetical protein